MAPGLMPTPVPSDTLAPANPTPMPVPSDTPEPASPTSPAEPVAWWDDTVFFEVFVRSFYDSDGDGNGDLRGLVEKLDYLNDGDRATGDDLGVTGLWLMPIAASPSYHGYDVTDYRSVNPDYGTNEDFGRLIDEAHRRGMRVIVDLVLNHTSDQHPWFVDSASGPDTERRDWYIWSETDPGYLGPMGQQVWHARDGAYYYGLFWEGMPDLNLENADVRAELYEVARFWLEEMGADGFRLDAARHYVEDGDVQAHTSATHAWLGEFYAFAKGVNPEMLTVGEIWDVSDAVAPYVGDELDLAFEFSLAKAILLSVNEERVTPLASAMKEVQRLYPEGGYATFLTNHDQNRVMDQLSGDPDKARLAATVLLTLPGVPFIYYGEEIGMTGSKPDPMIRTPMQWTSGPNAGFSGGTPWEPVNTGHEELNAEVQLAEPDSLLNHYRALIILRRTHPALGVGGFSPVDSAGHRVYAFLRHVPDEQVLVVINFEDKAATDYALSLAEGSLSPGGYTVMDLLTGLEAAPLTVAEGGGFEGYLPLPELPARNALILGLVPGED
jgi:glycosidase